MGPPSWSFQLPYRTPVINPLSTSCHAFTHPCALECPPLHPSKPSHPVRNVCFAYLWASVLGADAAVAHLLLDILVDVVQCDGVVHLAHHVLGGPAPGRAEAGAQHLAVLRVAEQDPHARHQELNHLRVVAAGQATNMANTGSRHKRAE